MPGPVLLIVFFFSKLPLLLLQFLSPPADLVSAMVLAQNSKVPCFILIFSIQSSMVILVLRPCRMVTCYQTWHQVWRASFIQPPDCSCWCPYFVCRKQMWHLGTRDGSFPGRNHGHHLYSTPQALGDGAPLRNGTYRCLERTWPYKMPMFQCAQ